MGRMSTYLTILIVLDLMFIITGQLCNGTGTCSFTSLIFSQIMNPSLATLSSWFTGLIGTIGDLLSGTASDSGIGSLLGTAATGLVAVGAVAFGYRSDSILFASTGVALSFLVGDFINIYAYIASSSPIVAILLFSPITVIYIFTCVEWVRGLA